MIALASENGNLLKIFADREQFDLGYHTQLGFIDKRSFQERARIRKNHKIKTEKNWVCEFSLSRAKEAVVASDTVNCSVSAASDKKWKLTTPVGSFLIGSPDQFDLWQSPEAPPEVPLKWKRPAGVGALLLLLLVFWPRPEEVKEEIKEPVTVQVAPQRNSVAIQRPKVAKVKTLTEEEKQQRRKQRAIAQNLGFLKMVGKKDLTKAMGSVPTQLKDVSAGAGQGTEGSGGELLVGLGKGLKRTTVGNTGVKGLGGVGSQGTGGGAGGYGETLVASGAGRLSGMPVADDILLEGGLDRAVVQATIAKYLSQVRACYENGLTKRPGIRGQVTTQFEINGGGNLNFAKVVRTSLGDSGVEKCIVARMLTWKFPKPRGGVNVSVKYPFLLRPVNVGD